MLKIGQKLWYYDKNRKKFGYVLVAAIEKNTFSVWYNGRMVKRDYDVIGKKLFTTPPLYERNEQERRKQYILNRNAWREEQKKKRKTMPETPPDFSYQEKENVEIGKSCDRCALRKNGSCGSIANKICEDYKPIQFIPENERKLFPEYGDATAIRKRDRKRFRK